MTWNAESAANILSKHRDAVSKPPVLKYVYRYELNHLGNILHIAVTKGRKDGVVSAYINRQSISGECLKNEMINGVTEARKYDRGHKGKTGGVGILSSVAELETLNPEVNDVVLIHIYNSSAFEKLIEWYMGILSLNPQIANAASNSSNAGNSSFLSAGDESPEIPDKLGNDGSPNPDLYKTNSAADKRVMLEIMQRRGQPIFRENLLKAYSNRCCVTGCVVEEVLEAAHITPHADDGSYDMRNGLLLRSDIHTLFDLSLLAIDHGYHVRISSKLNNFDYASLAGKRITLPNEGGDYPDTHALKERMANLVS